jgi:hypothetical protein
MIVNSVQLRSERKGGSNGRVYTIYFELSDESGNPDSAFYYVSVPHNNGAEAIDDGAIYEVFFRMYG